MKKNKECRSQCVAISNKTCFVGQECMKALLENLGVWRQHGSWRWILKTSRTFVTYWSWKIKQSDLVDCESADSTTQEICCSSANIIIRNSSRSVGCKIMWNIAFTPCVRIGRRLYAIEFVQVFRVFFGMKPANCIVNFRIPSTLWTVAKTAQVTIFSFNIRHCRFSLRWQVVWTRHRGCRNCGSQIHPYFD